MDKAKKTNGIPKEYIVIGGITIVVLAAYLFFQFKFQTNSLDIGTDQSRNSEKKSQISKNNCLADDCLAVQDLNYPAGELPTEVKNTLDEALNDEYKALSTYEKVISVFGQVRPFSMIKGAEEQHIASLKAIYDKYGLEIPENEWINNTSFPTTLQQACQTGVDAEIANAALYRDKLLPAVTEYEDITVVFTNLMNASQLKHLPAFDRCN